MSKSTGAASTHGLFHTVTASTPRAKRLARVYPHSRAASRGATAHPSVRELSTAPRSSSGARERQHSGDSSSNRDADAALSRQSDTHADALAAWRQLQPGHTGTSDADVDEYDDEQCWSDGDSSIAWSATLVQQQLQRVSSIGSSSNWNDGTAEASAAVTRTRNSVHDDVLTRVATLRALCDQGFLTHDEYERRKAAILDELSTPNRNNAAITTVQQPSHRRLGDVNNSRSPLIVPHSPNFVNVAHEAAIKHVFDYATREWRSTSVHVALDETPFSKGSLRVVYHLLDVTTDADATTKSQCSYVAKVAIDPDEDPQTYFRDTELQAHCAYYAQRYNSYHPPKRVEFIEAWVLELTERYVTVLTPVDSYIRNGALCAVEPYIPGEYRKHNNNFGSVSDDERSTPQAFSHFTYEASGHDVLAVDIQGVGDLYTDPQIHTLKGTDFGKGNLGVLGFHKFLSSHRCNSICHYLKLPAVNPKDRHADSGTLPVQELMNRDRVRPTQFDSTHYYEHAPMLQKYITQCRALEQNNRPIANPRQRQSQQNARAEATHALPVLRLVASLFCCSGGA